ncbi:hypothetical protein [Halorubrum sp. 48-1-W]|uniref:hypothetical protein n=1 Tax=Halorubrum sp. 48-1-W TaxID=2249761 RepID=UPI0018E55EF2|nr:hypothetical protein [Halorubrum sp. 48-1-W]
MTHLALTTLGVDGDAQPRDEYPTLPPGIHLRWAFPPHRGFPRGGYYLFRRRHREAPLRPRVRLTAALAHDPATPLTEAHTEAGHRFDFPEHERVSHAQHDGSDAVMLVGSDPVPIELPEPSYAVDVSVDVGGSDPVVVRALTDDRVVDETETTGGQVRLTGDRIDAVSCTGGEPKQNLVYVTEVAPHFVSSTLGRGWQLVPNAPAPIRLPLAHADYAPVSADGPIDDLDEARTVARDRIEYGPPDRLVDAEESVSGTGTVAVSPGSSYAFTSDQSPEDDLVGDCLRIDGDPTAYGITDVGEAPDGSTRLVLSRPYRGAGGSDLAYELLGDEFASLHDTLSVLVDEGGSNGGGGGGGSGGGGSGGGGSGGGGSGGMANRTMPAFRAPDGLAVVNGGGSTVAGWNTDWTTDLVGSRLRIATGSHTDVIAVHGRPYVFTTNAGWDDATVGRRIRIEDDRELYRIVDVAHFRVGERTLEICTLDRPVSGPYYGDSLDCVVYEGHTHRIGSVDEADQRLHLRGRVGLRPALPRRYLIHPAATPDAVASRSTQNPLDSVLTAATDPAAAQALGLYWIDDTVDGDASYDYMIVADHAGAITPGKPGAEREPALRARSPASSTPAIDRYVAFDVSRSDDDPLPAPEEPMAFELPVTADTANAVGIRWDMDDLDATAPDVATPVKYHLWRWDGDEPWRLKENSDLARYDPVTADSRTDLLTDATPILATTPATGRPRTPEGWPDVRLHATDGTLADGWYSYRVVGVDVFGRFSEPSEPATWVTSAPPGPPTPAGSTHRDVAIRVEDDSSPPSPTAIEAATLDPAAYDDPDELVDADPDDVPANRHVRGDEAYRNWRAGDPERVGIRVRWTWPAAHADLADDVDAFELYVSPGRTNAFGGEVLDVDPTSTGYEVTVGLDDTFDADPGTLAGTRLLVDDAAFPVRAATATAEGVTLTVRPPVPSGDETATDGGSVETDGGETDELVSETDGRATDVVAMFPQVGGALDVDRSEPTVGDRCTVSVPTHYDAGTVSVDAGSTATVDGTTGTVVDGHDTGWTEAVEGMRFRSVDDDVTYTVARVDGPTELVLDREVAASTPGEHLPYRIDHPLWDDERDPDSWDANVATVAYDDTSALVGTDGLTGTDDGTRVYEAFVDAPASEEGEAFAPSRSMPTVYADVAVTAVDDAGHESAVDATATIARVLHETPATPAVPVEPAAFRHATEPDYDGESAYTVRWEPDPDAGDDYGYHVFRALDETLFATDWERRLAAADDGDGDGTTDDDGDGPELSLDPYDPDHERFFPPAYRGDDEATETARETIAAEVNGLTALAEEAVSGDGHDSDDPDGVVVETAMQAYRRLRKPADADDAGDADAESDADGPDDAGDADAESDTDDANDEPDESTAAVLRPATLATLAALPGNEPAFSQRTVDALVPSDHPDRVGPDGDPDDEPDADLCAWVDRFDGSSRNVYCYRVGAIDDAGNRSDIGETDDPPMSYPTMPVRSAGDVPPRRPRIVEATAGHADLDTPDDRAITLRIAGVDDPTLDHLLVYRSRDPERATDLRRADEPEVVADPAAPRDSTAAGGVAVEDGVLEWVDADVEPFTTTYYRVVGVGESGVHTEPTAVASAEAFDRSPPDPPTWDEEDPTVDDDGAVTLSWSPAVGAPSDLRYRVHRRPHGGDEDDWRPVSPWLDRTEYEDGSRGPTATYDYRLLVLQPTGGRGDLTLTEV